MKYQTLSLSDVAQQQEFEPIWLINNAAKSFVGATGNLIICIPRLNGAQLDVLRLERTWLPIDATTQVPRSQLLQSTEFRKAVAERILLIISNEDAQRLLRQDGADEEQRRLATEREYIRSATGASALSANSIPVTGADEDDTENENPATAQFDDWVRSLASKSDAQVIAELRTRPSTTRKQAKQVFRALDPVKHMRAKNLLDRSLQR